MRLPALPERPTYLAEILDAFESDLDRGVEFLDGVEIEDAEICVYLYGSDPARLVEATRRVLGDLDITEGAYAVQTVAEHGGRVVVEQVQLAVLGPE